MFNFCWRLVLSVVVLSWVGKTNSMFSRHTLSAMNKNRGGLKAVYNYIESYLHTHLPQTSRSMIATLLDQMNLAANFQLYSRTRGNQKLLWKYLFLASEIQNGFGKVNLTDVCYTQAENENFPATQLKSDKWVTKASGQILFLFELQSVQHKGFGLYSCLNHVWMFDLNSHVILNVTIHEISFQSRLLECALEQLKIQMALGVKTVKDVPNPLVDWSPEFVDNWKIRNYAHTWRDITKVLKDELHAKSYIFCGQHSMFSVFPHFRKVDVRIIATRFVAIKFNASFTLLDHSVVYSVETSNFSEPKPVVAYIIRKDLFSFVYHIQVQKVNNLVVKVSRQKLIFFVVFDGPGFLCPIAVATDNTVRVSSFQCLVQLLTSVVSKHMARYLMFFSLPAKVSKIFHADHENVSLWLPTEQCKPILCVMSFQAQGSYRVNVTLTKMIFIGDKSLTCKYGGFLVAEETFSRYSESVTVCQNHNYPQFGRSFYSKNSSLKMVLFWYPHYSIINISVVSSETKCKAVQIDICTIFYLCEPLFLNTNKWNSPECTSHLNEATTLSIVLKGSKNENYLLFMVMEMIVMFYKVFKITSWNIFPEKHILLLYSKRQHATTPWHHL